MPLVKNQVIRRVLASELLKQVGSDRLAEDLAGLIP
jgi:hypothetical protein